MKKNRITNVCTVCGKNYEIKACRKLTAKYCSKVCMTNGSIGHRPYNYNGGKYMHKGYVLLLQKNHPLSRDGYVYEHRIVMEQHIGRFLSEKEVVHHKNNIRSDNRIENLELLSSQSEHFKEHIHEIMEINRKKPHPWIGRKHSEESKKKMSKTRSKKNNC